MEPVTTAPPTEAAMLRALDDAAKRLDAAQAAIGAAHLNASILVGAAGAILGGALALAGRAPGPILTAGVVVLLGALVAAGGVIFPRLRRRTAERARDALYFGELRRWSPLALAAHLAARAPVDRLGDYCRQIVTVSAIAHGKHRCYRAALLITGAGAALVLAAYLVEIGP